jgi:hypothetical protein
MLQVIGGQAGPKAHSPFTELVHTDHEHATDHLRNGVERALGGCAAARFRARP